ncbi:hypothetical protein [Azospirillum sp.]|uniref:hypothetical protein n=1 Tax=Azospirillum sp. TaxID=34012 RepID=UPI00261D83FE|nr:hypothetical protein [Azospirillum sp.]
MKKRVLGAAYEKYRSSVNPFVDIKDKSYGGWISFCKWYDTEGKSLFSSAFVEVSGKRFIEPNSDDWLITTGISSTEADYEKKIRKIDYYRVNAFWFQKEIEQIIKTIPNDESYKTLNIAYGQVLSFVDSLVKDSLVLLRECASLRSGLNEAGFHKNPVTRLDEFYVSARYLVYGSFAVGHHSDVSISVIRQALEIRLRRALGVIAKVDTSGIQHPISLSEIIAVLEPFGSKIDIKIPISSLKRINGWANMYLHSGLKEYAWVSPRVLEYLADFLLGGDSAPGYVSTVNSGVIMDEKTFQEIRMEIERNCAPKFKLFALDPERCALVIKKNEYKIP